MTKRHHHTSDRSICHFVYFFVLQICQIVSQQNGICGKLYFFCINWKIADCCVKFMKNLLHCNKRVSNGSSTRRNCTFFCVRIWIPAAYSWSNWSNRKRKTCISYRFTWVTIHQHHRKTDYITSKVYHRIGESLPVERLRCQCETHTLWVFVNQRQTYRYVKETVHQISPTRRFLATGRRSFISPY